MQTEAATTDAPKRQGATPNTAATIHPETRLTRSQVMALVGVRYTKFAEMLREGFPQPERHSQRMHRWRAADVFAHLEAKRQQLQKAS